MKQKSPRSKPRRSCCCSFTAAALCPEDPHATYTTCHAFQYTKYVRKTGRAPSGESFLSANNIRFPFVCTLFVLHTVEFHYEIFSPSLLPQYLSQIVILNFSDEGNGWMLLCFPCFNIKIANSLCSSLCPTKFPKPLLLLGRAAASTEKDDVCWLLLLRTDVLSLRDDDELPYIDRGGAE